MGPLAITTVAQNHTPPSYSAPNHTVPSTIVIVEQDPAPPFLACPSQTVASTFATAVQDPTAPPSPAIPHPSPTQMVASIDPTPAASDFMINTVETPALLQSHEDELQEEDCWWSHHMGNTGNHGTLPNSHPVV